MAPILAIDPSSKKLALTLTYTDDPHEEPNMWVIDLPAGIENGTVEAYVEIRRTLLDIYSDLQYREPVRVYLESPILGKWNPHATIIQSQASGAILASVGNFRPGDKYEPRAYLIGNTTWKKWVVGKGNATKADIAVKLKEIWPVAFELANGDQDLIDSAMINRYGSLQQKTLRRLKRKLTDGTRSSSQASSSKG